MISSLSAALSAALPSSPVIFVILFGVAAAIIYVRLVTFCIDDLYKPERVVVGFSKDVWAIIIVLGSVAGIAVYLLYGRANS